MKGRRYHVKVGKVVDRLICEVCGWTPKTAGAFVVTISRVGWRVDLCLPCARKVAREVAK